MLPKLKESFKHVDWAKLEGWASAKAGCSLVYVLLDDGTAAAVLALTDPVRPEARPAAAALVRAFGGEQLCEIWLCTGDNHAAASVAGKELQIPPDRLRAGQLPADKKALVDSLQTGGAQVIMVGDGLNLQPWRKLTSVWRSERGHSWPATPLMWCFAAAPWSTCSPSGSFAWRPG